MLKVFLVEDELLIREGIKKMPWEEEGFSFVGEASDGELAYPMIMEKKPDILITDIRMPFMDGIELSRLVREKLPETKVIFLSGYNEFEYAKEAISIGVTDYLLKPINAAKLMEAIHRVAEVIEKDRENKWMLEQYQKEMRKDLNLERRKLFSKLLYSELSVREIVEQGEKLNLDFAASYLAVLVFTLSTPLGNYRQYSQELNETEAKIRDLVERQDCMTIEWTENTWIYLVKGESRQKIDGKIEQIVEAIVSVMDSHRNLYYFGGVGETVQRLRDLGRSYQEANKAFSTRFFTTEKKIVYSSEVGEQIQVGEMEVSIQDLDTSAIDRRKIERFLKEGTKGEIHHFVEEYFNNIGEESYSSLLFRQYVMMDIYLCVLAFLKEIEVGAQELPERYRQVTRIVNHIHTIGEGKEYLEAFFSEAMDLRDNCAQKKYRDLIQNAVAYILEHYQDEDISLNVLASYVNISPSYFSSVFSQETGRTFVEYLTSVRMDRAKELLRCTNKRSSEIAASVGYQDSHYFSFLFKKTCGCTPSDYRKQKKEEG